MAKMYAVSLLILSGCATGVNVLPTKFVPSADPTVVTTALDTPVVLYVKMTPAAYEALPEARFIASVFYEESKRVFKNRVAVFEDARLTLSQDRVGIVMTDITLTPTPGLLEKTYTLSIKGYVKPPGQQAVDISVTEIVKDDIGWKGLTGFIGSMAVPVLLFPLYFVGGIGIAGAYISHEIFQDELYKNAVNDATLVSKNQICSTAVMKFLDAAGSVMTR